MKQSELMIGDWVRVPSELNRPKVVRSTFDLDEAVLYHPIRLTSKILEDNGFYKGSVNEYKIVRFSDNLDEDGDKKLDFSVFIFPNSFVQIKKNNNIFRFFCNELHKLQQAIRLAGIEENLFKKIDW